MKGEKTMKKRTILRAIRVTALLGVSILVSQARAASGSVSGTVALLQIQSVGTGNNFFTLNSTATVGKCITSSGHVMALFPDDDRGKAMMSTVQAAVLSGKSLTVQVDDKGATSPTYCFVSWIQFQ